MAAPPETDGADREREVPVIRPKTPVDFGDFVQADAQSSVERKAAPSPVKTPDLRRQAVTVRSDSSLARRELMAGENGESPEGKIRLTVSVADHTLPYIPLTADQMIRESMIKKHFESKVNQLTTQLQLVDSQGVKYHHDTKLLTQRIITLEADRTKLGEDRETARRAEREMLEKMTTTEKGYSSQLNLMTEHIYSLNAKIAEQEALIDKYRRARAAAKTK